jgi:hypothetical protein
MNSLKIPKITSSVMVVRINKERKEEGKERRGEERKE